MKTEKELKELRTEIEILNRKLAELTEEELGSVVGGGSAEIAETLIKGLMSDKPHPGFVTMADNSKDPKSAQRSENCSNFL